MVDIQSAASEIRRGKKRKKKEQTTGWKYNDLPYSIGRPLKKKQEKTARQRVVKYGVWNDFLLWIFYSSKPFRNGRRRHQLADLEIRQGHCIRQASIDRHCRTTRTGADSRRDDNGKRDAVPLPYMDTADGLLLNQLSDASDGQLSNISVKPLCNFVTTFWTELLLLFFGSNLGFSRIVDSLYGASWQCSRLVGWLVGV